MQGGHGAGARLLRAQVVRDKDNVRDLHDASGARAACARAAESVAEMRDDHMSCCDGSIHHPVLVHLIICDPSMQVC